MNTTEIKIPRRALSAEEVADILGVSPETVRVWARRRHIRGHKVGHYHAYRFHPEVVKAYLSHCLVPQE